VVREIDARCQLFAYDVTFEASMFGYEELALIRHFFSLLVTFSFLQGRNERLEPRREIIEIREYCFVF
jgi:hypothetical protein